MLKINSETMVKNSSAIANQIHSLECCNFRNFNTSFQCEPIALQSLLRSYYHHDAPHIRALIKWSTSICATFILTILYASCAPILQMDIRAYQILHLYNTTIIHIYVSQKIYALMHDIGYK